MNNPIREQIKDIILGSLDAGWEPIDTKGAVDQILSAVISKIPEKVQDHDSRWNREATDDDYGNELFGDRCYGFNQAIDQMKERLK